VPLSVGTCVTFERSLFWAYVHSLMTFEGQSKWTSCPCFSWTHNFLIGKSGADLSAEDLVEVDEANAGASKSLFKPTSSEASHLLKDNFPKGRPNSSVTICNSQKMLWNLCESLKPSSCFYFSQLPHFSTTDFFKRRLRARKQITHTGFSRLWTGVHPRFPWRTTTPSLFKQKRMCRCGAATTTSVWAATQKSPRLSCE